MSLCTNCQTPQRVNGLPSGLCPDCGTFWIPTQGATGYAVMAISAEDYQRWYASNALRHGGNTVPLALQQLPNVRAYSLGGGNG